MSGIQIQPCCCGCTCVDIAILVSDCNLVTDDYLKMTWNGANLGTFNFYVATACSVGTFAPGVWFTTNNAITLATLNKIVANNAAPAPGTGLNEASGGTFTTVGLGNTPTSIITAPINGNNTFNITSVLNNSCSNFGCVWFIIFQKDAASSSPKWKGCYYATYYNGDFQFSQDYTIAWQLNAHAPDTITSSSGAAPELPPGGGTNGPYS